MTYTTFMAALLHADVFGSDELPGWSHPVVAAAEVAPVGAGMVGVGLDFFASDDLPGWSRPSFTVAA
jgi:hypothetical protein